MTHVAQSKGSAWREIVVRSLLAIVGGYVFTYALVAALARVLPLERVDTTVVVTLLSFVIYLIFLLWAFAARSSRRVGLVVASSAVFAAIGFWPQLLKALGQ